jgi:hypothetical protein
MNSTTRGGPEGAESPVWVSFGESLVSESALSAGESLAPGLSDGTASSGCLGEDVHALARRSKSMGSMYRVSA